MIGAQQELVRARQNDLDREARNKRRVGDLHSERRRDGTLWIFRLPRR